MNKLEFDITPYLGDCVWNEDDALPVDRERLESAIVRLTSMSMRRIEREPELEVDSGDCTWEIYSDWVICRSYPGNTAIYKRKNVVE